jgi:hypothetical protein
VAINIVNKHWHKPTDHDIYIGRGSPLGNPYSHMDGTKALYKVVTREEAIEKYREWLERTRLNDPVLAAMLHEMRRAHLDGHDINLVCYCAPARCHGEIIKELLEKECL